MHRVGRRPDRLPRSARQRGRRPRRRRQGAVDDLAVDRIDRLGAIPQPNADPAHQLESAGEEPGEAAVSAREVDGQDDESFPQVFEPLDLLRQGLLNILRADDVAQAGLGLQGELAIARIQSPHLVVDLLVSFLSKHCEDSPHVRGCTLPHAPSSPPPIRDDRPVHSRHEPLPKKLRKTRPSGREASSMATNADADLGHPSPSVGVGASRDWCATSSPARRAAGRIGPPRSDHCRCRSPRGACWTVHRERRCRRRAAPAIPGPLRSAPARTSGRCATRRGRR